MIFLKTDSKIIKVLRILTLTLTIILLVFSLMKKVGLAAEDSNNGVFPVYSYDQYFPSIDGYSYSDFVSEVESIFTYSYVLSYYINDNGHFFYFVIFPYSNNALFRNIDIITDSSYIDTTTGSLIVSSGDACYYGQNRSGACTIYKYQLINNHLSYVTKNEYGYYTLNSYTLVNRKYFYCRTPLYDSYNNIVFEQGRSHSQGGVLADFSEGLTEFADSNINPVDDSAPVDSSSTPSWLQKILSALGKINNTVGGGFTYIGGLFSGLFDSIGSKIDSFREIVSDKFDTIINFFRLPTSEEVSSGVASILSGTPLGSLISQLTSFSQTITNIMGAGIVVPTSLQFTHNYNLFGVQGTFTLDFDWYNTSVRNTVVGVFLTWFYAGVFLHFVFQIPSMLNGASGAEKDSGNMHITERMSRSFHRRFHS